MSVEDYFATVFPAGAGRVAEMIDESAFFTANTQRRSGEWMLLIVFFALVVAGLAWFALGPQLGGDARINAARLVLALAVFLLSSDVLGGAFAHLRAATSMAAVRYRLSGSRTREHLHGDVVQAMADYNAFVEGAPLPLPGVFKRRQADLNRAWQEYKRLSGIGVRA
jgi:hypothetical protein